MADFEVVIYDYTEYDKPEELVSYDMYVKDEINSFLEQFGENEQILDKIQLFTDNYLDMVGAIVIYYLGKLLKQHITKENIQDYIDNIALIAEKLIHNESYTPFTFEFGEKRNMMIEVTRLFD